MGTEVSFDDLVVMVQADLQAEREKLEGIQKKGWV